MTTPQEFDSVPDTAEDAFPLETTARSQPTRHQLAQAWLTLETDQLATAYAGNLGQQHRALLQQHIQLQPPSAVEQVWGQQWLTVPSTGKRATQTLLAGMLYGYPHQLPAGVRQPHRLPRWLWSDYLSYLLTPPALFRQSGEVDAYYHFLQGWMQGVLQVLQEQPEHAFGQAAALAITQRASFLPVYFVAIANLKPFYTLRANILTLTLEQLGHELNPTLPERPRQRRKIRLGIFNNHFAPQTETFATLPVFEKLDRDRFEVILYALKWGQHPLEQYCRDHADRVVTLPADLQGAAAQLQADTLDMLWFGSNLTAVGSPSTLLATHRLAPIQVTSICSPITTGMSSMDYYIAGTLSAPDADQYHERLATVEGSGICFRFPLPEKAPTQTWTWERLNLSEEAVVFISGANFYKITPELQALWAQVLTAVPNAVLVLYPFNPNWSDAYPRQAFEAQMQAVFVQAGLTPERLHILSPFPSHADVLACVGLADVYLDSLPYGGATSLLDPLTVGVPPVVYEGDALRFRQPAALLRELQVPDLITHSADAYRDCAIALGRDPERRQQFRQLIQERMANRPSFLDSAAFSQQIGTLLQQLWQNWQQNQPPKKQRLSPKQL